LSKLDIIASQKRRKGKLFFRFKASKLVFSFVSIVSVIAALQAECVNPHCTSGWRRHGRHNNDRFHR
jgi:hypothetical protein